jgi:hypothetical protein
MTIIGIIIFAAIAAKVFMKWFTGKADKAETKKKMEGKVALCPSCGCNLVEIGRFVKTMGTDVQVFRCANRIMARNGKREKPCNDASKWNFEVDPPSLLGRG